MSHNAHTPLSEEQIARSYDKETKSLSLRYRDHPEKINRWLRSLRKDDRQMELLTATQEMLRAWGFSTNRHDDNAVMRLLIEAPCQAVAAEMPQPKQHEVDRDSPEGRLHDRFHRTLEVDDWGAPLWHIGVHKFRVNYGTSAVSRMLPHYVNIFQVNFDNENIFDPEFEMMKGGDWQSQHDSFDKICRVFDQALHDTIVALATPFSGITQGHNRVFCYPMYLYVHRMKRIQEILYSYNHQYRRARNLCPVSFQVQEQMQNNLHYVNILLENK